MRAVSRANDKPLPLRRQESKNKTTPLTETANYNLWSLLKYLIIFTSRQKCPEVIELPSWTFIEVTAASPTSFYHEVKQGKVDCGAKFLKVQGFGSQARTFRVCRRIFCTPSNTHNKCICRPDCTNVHYLAVTNSALKRVEVSSWIPSVLSDYRPRHTLAGSRQTKS